MRSGIIQNVKSNNHLLDLMMKNMKSPGMLLRAGGSNNIGWILGHITLSRGKMLQMIGGEGDISDGEMIFSRDTKKNGKIKIEMEETIQKFYSRGDRLINALVEMAGEALDQPIDFSLPGGGSDIGTYVLFSILHESFHLGQIDLIKASNGLNGIP